MEQTQSAQLKTQSATKSISRLENPSMLVAYTVIGLLTMFTLTCWSASEPVSNSGSSQSLNERLENLKRELKSIEVKDSRLPSLAKQAEDLVKDFESRCNSHHSVNSKKVELKHFKNEEGETEVELKPMVQHLNNLNDDILMQVQCSEKLKDAKRLSRKFNRLSMTLGSPIESKPEKRQARQRKSSKPSIAKSSSSPVGRSIASHQRKGKKSRVHKLDQTAPEALAGQADLSSTSSMSVASHNQQDPSVTVVPVSQSLQEKTINEANLPQTTAQNSPVGEASVPVKRKNPFDP